MPRTDGGDPVGRAQARPSTYKIPAMERTFEPSRAPARVLQVIYEIANSSKGLSLSRLVALTGLPKTSVLTLLRSLEASNYVVNVAGAYQLGPQTLSVARAIMSKERLAPTVHAVMESLHADTGETVLFSVLADDEPAAEAIEVIETRKPIRLSFPVGLRRPLYCSAIGKLLLAHQPQDWIDDYLARTTLTAYTPHTVTSKAELLRQLAHIRATGLSVSHHGMIEDASGISAAVWNAGNQMFAGISVMAPTYRIERDEDRFRQLILAAGEDISRKLGYAGPYPPPAIVRRAGRRKRPSPGRAG